jgi:hypothetical protein
MNIYSVTVCLVIEPFTIVYRDSSCTCVSISMFELSLPTCFIIFPISPIGCSIWPYLYSVAITPFTDPKQYNIIVTHSPV